MAAGVEYEGDLLLPLGILFEGVMNCPNLDGACCGISCGKKDGLVLRIEESGLTGATGLDGRALSSFEKGLRDSTMSSTFVTLFARAVICAAWPCPHLSAAPS